MTNNKQQTTIIELFLNEIGQYIDTSEITDSVIEKYILMERANIELIENTSQRNGNCGKGNELFRWLCGGL
jgi:hypothetical protein